MLMDKETNRNARKRAREEGLAEGALREKYATARNMKAKGLAADLIADVTGLSIDEIEKM